MINQTTSQGMRDSHAPCIAHSNHSINPRARDKERDERKTLKQWNQAYRNTCCASQKGWLVKCLGGSKHWQKTGITIEQSVIGGGGGGGIDRPYTQKYK